MPLPSANHVPQCNSRRRPGRPGCKYDKKNEKKPGTPTEARVAAPAHLALLVCFFFKILDVRRNRQAQLLVVAGPGRYSLGPRWTVRGLI